MKEIIGCRIKIAIQLVFLLVSWSLAASGFKWLDLEEMQPVIFELRFFDSKSSARSR